MYWKSLPFSFVFVGQYTGSFNLDLCFEYRSRKECFGGEIRSLLDFDGAVFLVGNFKEVVNPLERKGVLKFLLR